MASKQKKEAMAALDEANKEYKQVCSELKSKYKELDKASDNALVLISDVESLVESIRHRPWSFKAIKHKITVKKKKFVETKDLKRKERNKNITAGVVAGLAGGSIGLFVFMKDICKKNIILWIVCIALFVLVLAAFLVFKLFNGVMTAKKAYEQTKLVKEETNKNRTLYSKADSLIKKIEAESKAVSNYYAELKNCAESNYKELPEDTKEALSVLYNLALTLTELVSTQIG